MVIKHWTPSMGAHPPYVCSSLRIFWVETLEILHRKCSLTQPSGPTWRSTLGGLHKSNRNNKVSTFDFMVRNGWVSGWFIVGSRTGWPQNRGRENAGLCSTCPFGRLSVVPGNRNPIDFDMMRIEGDGLQSPTRWAQQVFWSMVSKWVISPACKWGILGQKHMVGPKKHL